MGKEGSNSNPSIAIRSMSSLIAPVDRQPRRPVVRHLRRMAEIAEVTKAGMSEIGDVSSYAAYEAARTLVTANLWEQAAQLSPQEKEKLGRLKDVFLSHLACVTSIADEKIVALIRNLPPEAQPSAWDEFWDTLLGG